MDKVENNSIEKEEIEIGKCYIIYLTAGAFLSGVLISKGECLTKEGVQIYFKFALSDDRFIDLNKKEILSMSILDSLHDNKQQYLKNFEHKHNVKCIDVDNDEILSNSVILGNVIVEKGIWDELLESEKKEFINQLDLSTEDIVDIINICVDYMRENKKLHDNKLKILTALDEILEKYNEAKKLLPQFSDIYDWIYKESGFENLISTI